MIEQTLGRYEIQERIGAGGMGAVYRARDPKLERDVAVKVLSSEVSSSIHTERFEHEVRLAAGLQHPNIVPVHDVGEANGQLYYVMALVEGRTLRERIEDAGRLNVEEALGYARDVASALDYAHRHDVVHRDVKPANILLSDGKALVADFGLAMATGDSDEPRLTRSGVALGTPLYMSPEQASGARNVDGRSDIYSLACVVFEALTGRPPFVGETTRAIMMGHIANEPESVRATRPDVSPEVDQALATALAKAPEHRFARASVFAEALSGSGLGGSSAGSGATTAVRPAVPAHRFVKRAAAVGLAVAMLALAYVYRDIGDPPPAAGEIAPQTVAVMPFTNSSGSDALSATGVGIAQTLTTQLSTLPTLRVLAGPETDAGPNVRRIAKELGVSHVVRGSLQEDAGRLQVNVNLVRSDNTVAWGGVYEGSGDLFELQRQVAQGLSEALSLQLSAAARAQRDLRPTEDRDAYAEYVQGRAFLERRDLPGNLERARRLLTSATARDESFALAHSALGETRWQSFRDTKDPGTADTALSAARRAKELDPGHPYVRYVLASVLDGQGRTDEAIVELEHALKLQPNYDAALALVGQIHGRKDVDLAIDYVDRAIDGRPGYWGHHRDKGKILLNSGRYQDAAAAFARVTELQPDSAWGFQQLGVSYHYLDELELALDNYEKAVAIAPSAAAYSNMGTIHYRNGHYDNAIGAYMEALEIRPNSALTHGNLGDAYRRKGNGAKAEPSYLRALAIVTEGLIVNPRDGRRYSLRALYEAKLGRESEAMDDIGRAVEFRPHDVSVLRRRAATLALLRREKEALDAIERALAAGASVSEFRQDDSFDLLRTSPRYIALIN